MDFVLNILEYAAFAAAGLVGAAVAILLFVLAGLAMIEIITLVVRFGGYVMLLTGVALIGLWSTRLMGMTALTSIPAKEVFPSAAIIFVWGAIWAGVMFAFESADSSDI